MCRGFSNYPIYPSAHVVIYLLSLFWLVPILLRPIATFRPARNAAAFPGDCHAGRGNDGSVVEPLRGGTRDDERIGRLPLRTGVDGEIPSPVLPRLHVPFLPCVRRHHEGGQYHRFGGFAHARANRACREARRGRGGAQSAYRRCARPGRFSVDRRPLGNRRPHIAILERNRPAPVAIFSGFRRSCIASRFGEEAQGIGRRTGGSRAGVGTFAGRHDGRHVYCL